MSLYNERFDFAFVKEKIIPVLPLIIGALILTFAAGFVVMSLLSFFQPKAIALSLQDNPLNLTKGDKTYSTLTVVITNTGKENAEKVLVEIKAIDFKSITIDGVESKSETIELLGAGESRTLKFFITPADKNEILQGKYNLQVKAVINGEEYIQETMLEIINI